MAILAIAAGASIGTEAVLVCSSIAQLLSKIEDFEDDWFNKSVEFQKEADVLRSKLEFYQDLVSIHGLPANSTMMMTLHKAEETLKRADARLAKLRESIEDDKCHCSLWWWWYAKVTVTFFHKFENIFQIVSQDIENISKDLKQQLETRKLMREDENMRPNSGAVHNNDDLYVPIERTQATVITAIEDCRGPFMILLHGGVGKGKSTLARYVYHLYHAKTSGEKKNMFKQVFLVSCSTSSTDDLSLTKFEILKHIRSPGTGSSGDSQLKGKLGSQSSASSEDIASSKDMMLVILDDVLDPRLLQEMWSTANGGKDRVKYLVTSQNRDLCYSFKADSLLIAMENPKKDEGWKILSSLVGLKSKVIPDGLQEIADEMIKETEGNPLALACLAGNFISSENKTDEGIWLDTRQNLRKLLNRPNEIIVLGLDSNGKARPKLKGFWDAMELCINSLETSDAKAIIFLIYACNKASMPEEVLRIVHERVGASDCSFLKCTAELSMRELLKPGPGGLKSCMESKARDGEPQSSKYSRAWSLRPLVKLYMEHNMAAGNDSIVSAILNSLVGGRKSTAESTSVPRLMPVGADSAETNAVETQKAKVAIALCALYFDPGHTDEAVNHGARKAREAISRKGSGLHLNDVRRQAIEPIIWLLGQQEKGREWTEADLRCARKVFLNYICENQLDGNGISALLKLNDCASAQLATLTALRSILNMQETSLRFQNTGCIMQAVLIILESNGKLSANIEEAAWTVLTSLLESIIDRYPDKNSALRAQTQLALTMLRAPGDGPSSVRMKMVIGVIKGGGGVVGVLDLLSQQEKGTTSLFSNLWPNTLTSGITLPNVSSLQAQVTRAGLGGINYVAAVGDAVGERLLKLTSPGDHGKGAFSKRACKSWSESDFHHAQQEMEREEGGSGSWLRDSVAPASDDHCHESTKGSTGNVDGAESLSKNLSLRSSWFY